MSDKLQILVDGELRAVLDRQASLPGLERSWIEQIDEMLGQGIGSGPGRIENPGLEDKTQFVVGELVKALRAGNEAAIAKLCAYLAYLQPTLCRLDAITQGDDLDVRLLFSAAP